MLFCFFFKQKTAYEMRISDWSSDVCSSDLWATPAGFVPAQDQGYALAAIQLPPGSSIQQTDAVLKKVVKKLLDVPGTEAAVMFAGFDGASRSEEHTSELQSLMRISYAVFCLKKKNKYINTIHQSRHTLQSHDTVI